ncbi:Cyclin-D1-1 [Tetrabaena socialis]|uniref:Cyclin-D1-1 n=1 Tax=Tetrabaena socialis TaxID=47790 RepID=A0A2J7ZX34_9CHLO|nr:Cyclin-D1-1 [Tetrabaena socialis]|eukprot:PNH04822.1 Cyclin-D1-1 [Tetrabaena socialis]
MQAVHIYQSSCNRIPGILAGLQRSGDADAGADGSWTSAVGSLVAMGLAVVPARSDAQQDALLAAESAASKPRGGETAFGSAQRGFSEAAMAFRADLERQRLPRSSSLPPPPFPSVHPLALASHHQNSEGAGADGTEAAGQRPTVGSSPAAASAAAATSAAALSAAAVRALVVDWVAEVASLLALGSSSLFVAVALMDAFLARQAAPPPDTLMQLLALACLDLATRQEEAGRPHVPLRDWLTLAADPASGTELYEVSNHLSDLQRMELLVLEALERRTDAPTSHTFLRHLLQCLEHCDAEGGGPECNGGSRAGGGGGQTDGAGSMAAQPAALQRSHVNALAGALAELALPSAALQRFPPSTVATACVAFALQLTAAADVPAPPRGPVPRPGSESAFEMRIRHVGQRAAGSDSGGAGAYTDGPMGRGMGGARPPATPAASQPQLQGGAVSSSIAATFGGGPAVAPSILPSSPLPLSAIASPASPSGDTAVAAPPRAVAVQLAGVAGVGVAELAPGLEGCVAALAAVYQEAMAWFTGSYGGSGGGGGSLALPAVIARHAPLLSRVAAAAAAAMAKRWPSPARVSQGVLGKRGPQLS